MSSIPILRTMLCAFTLAAAPAVAQGCQVTVRQDISTHGVFCTWLRYCYTVTVPNGCLPVLTVCIDFSDTSVFSAQGTQTPGWTVSIDHVNKKVCWTVGAFGAPILGGSSKKFCIDTDCWPLTIEGIQSFQVQNSNAGAHTGDCALGAFAAVPNADGPGNLGAQRVVTLYDHRNPGRLGLAYASLLPAPAPVPVPGLGELLIDPNLASFWATLPLDAGGRGQGTIQVPPDPGLVGLRLWFQSLQVPDAHLSQRLVFPIL